MPDGAGGGRLAAASLWLSAAVFALFGATLLVAPDLLAVVDLAPATPAARSDVRAVFGGIELGVGALLAACALRPAWMRAGLAAQALTLGGASVGRLVSLAADGAPPAVTLAFWALETAGAALAAFALSRLPPPR